MPTIWLVTGNKGGVGKSVVATALASRLVMDLRFRDGAGNQTRVGVIDGDGRTPDVASMCPAGSREILSKVMDFRQLRPESTHSMVESRYLRVIKLFAKAGAEHIVINTPDGADDQILRWFQMMLMLDLESGDGGWNYKVLFVMSPSSDGLEYLLPISLLFDQVVPVRNRFFGEAGEWGTFRQQFEGCFERVIDFPALPGRSLDMLKRLKVMPGWAEGWRDDHGKGLPLVTLARVRGWDFDVGEALGDIMNSIEPNISDRNIELLRSRVLGLANGGGAAVRLADAIAAG